MKLHDDIKGIYASEIDYLVDGIKNGKSLYHTFCLSTLSESFPEGRTVVLRDVKRNPLNIYFNADYRSKKVKELISNKNCTALFYDQSRRVQLRLRCQAVVHYKNNLSSEIWKNTALQSRKCYMGPFPPSDELESWHPNIPDEYLKTDPDKEHSEEGYINFTHIELRVTEVDILQLRHDGHIRFKVSGDTLSYLAP